MVFGSLLKLLGLGGSPRPDSHRPVAGVQPATAPIAVSRALPVRRFIRREEIIDARCRIGGYRYRLAQSGTSAENYCNALQQSERVRAFANNRLAVISLPPDFWQQADFSSLVADHTLFEITLPESKASDPGLTALFETIRATGAGIAVTQAAWLQLPQAAISHVTMVTCNLAAQSIEDFERCVHLCRERHPDIWLTVDNVSDWSEQRFCLSLGAKYLMGGFVDSQDSVSESGGINQSRAIILEMLNLLRQNGSQKELADAAKRDPATAVQLLAMANSPLSGFTRKMASIDQAIMALGHDLLYRWLTMTLFRAGKDSPRLDALLEHALYRARFLELAGNRSLSKSECDQLFLVGLLSYTDVLLDIPMYEVLNRMQVVEDVRSVLLRGEGRFGPYLQLVLLMQQGNSEQLADVGEALGFDLSQITELHAAALDWADAMMST